MVSRKGALAIIIFFILIGPVGYTLNSGLTEPHTLNLTLTSAMFTEEMLSSNNSSNNVPPQSSPTALFFHNFTLDGSSATFGFSLHFYRIDIFPQGNSVPFTILVTKANQSIGPSHLGVKLSIKNANIKTEFNVNGTEIHNYGYNLFGGPTALNSSVAACYIEYEPHVFFTTINETVAQESGITYVSSYNLTYSMEVTPILELGPYYISGPTLWISHTFEQPFSNQTSI